MPNGKLTPKISSGKPRFEKPVVLFEWKAPARYFIKKSAAWFTALSLVALFLALLLLVFEQVSLTLLVLALAFVIFVWHFVEPAVNNYQVLSTGIKVGKESYDFSDLRYFWVEEVAESTLLHLATFLAYPPYLTLVLDVQIDQSQLETELLKHLPYYEEEKRDWIKSLDGFLEELSSLLPLPLVNFYEKTLNRGTAFLTSRFTRRH